MEHPAWATGEPCFDFRMLMSGVVVEDGMDRLVGWRRAFDGIEKADEFLMGMALHAAAEDNAIEGVDGGEQGGRAVPLVIVGHGPAFAGLDRQTRLCAIERPVRAKGRLWIWDFSSIESTTAWAGGCM